MYTNEQILSLFDNCCMDTLSEDTWHLEVVSSLNFRDSGISHEEFDRVDNGVSKGVIFLKDWDWVIKVPFTCGDGSYSWIEVRPSIDNTLGHFSAEWEKTFYGEGEKFIGANNSENEWDYCLREVELYKEAESAGLEKFFLEVRRIGFSKDNHPIYIQKRADAVGEHHVAHSCGHYEEEDLEEAREVSGKACRRLNAWGALSIMRQYGKDMAIRLAEFLINYCIGDLHGGNLGLYQSSFVLIDYSDFNS